jgi:hypothetical protein
MSESYSFDMPEGAELSINGMIIVSKQKNYCPEDNNKLFEFEENKLGCDHCKTEYMWDGVRLYKPKFQ